jgi:hypothetical protein
VVASCAACRFNVQSMMFGEAVRRYLDVQVVGWLHKGLRGGVSMRFVVRRLSRVATLCIACRFNVKSLTCQR